ncbi:MAG: ribosome small subunit-dependent GTPase A [Pseudomonadota bacterium]
MNGRIVAAHGRQFLVADGEETVECVMRGKKGGVACGDRVRYALTHPGSGVIEAVEPRDNLLYRSDEMREKLIAANVDQAVVVVAAVPLFREELLIRCLVACETADIPVLLVLNKADLPETAALDRHLAAYAALGYPVLRLSALGDVAELAGRLAGRTSVLVGGSGVGKSTLLNQLVPGAGAATGEISQALDAGRHTTTHARMFPLPGGAPGHPGYLIDSPGMQEFGLRHLDPAGLMAAFPEIRERIGQCRFYNCRHLKEPGCAVREAAEGGAMLPARYKVYQSLLGQLAG